MSAAKTSRKAVTGLETWPSAKKQWRGGKRSKGSEKDHVIAATNPIGKRPKSRLNAHIDDQHGSHDDADDSGIHMGGVDQIFLHVRRECVEIERAAHRKSEHDQDGALVV